MEKNRAIDNLNEIYIGLGNLRIKLANDKLWDYYKQVNELMFQIDDLITKIRERSWND